MYVFRILVTAGSRCVYFDLQIFITFHNWLTAGDQHPYLHFLVTV